MSAALPCTCRHHLPGPRQATRMLRPVNLSPSSLWGGSLPLCRAWLVSSAPLPFPVIKVGNSNYSSKCSQGKTGFCVPLTPRGSLFLLTWQNTLSASQCFKNCGVYVSPSSLAVFRGSVIGMLELPSPDTGAERFHFSLPRIPD